MYDARGNDCQDLFSIEHQECFDSKISLTDPGTVIPFLDLQQRRCLVNHRWSSVFLPILLYEKRTTVLSLLEVEGNYGLLSFSDKPLLLYRRVKVFMTVVDTKGENVKEILPDKLSLPLSGGYVLSPLFQDWM